MPTTTLPDATRLAVDRTRMAHDRTLMAWVRTSLSLISFGFTIYKFFEYLANERQSPTHQGLISPRVLAMMMIGIGVAALVLATFGHRADVRALRVEYGALVPNSLATVIATLVAGLGVFLFCAVVFRL